MSYHDLSDKPSKGIHQIEQKREHATAFLYGHPYTQLMLNSPFKKANELYEQIIESAKALSI
ncbi:hypothetical protein [Lysinibacillus sphaericus]|uniref:hypothetical protein n=1 Tax=Lysinibacillus sphaericus TaxID=1421 RepID=UPI000AC6FDE5|nr:hypothetical protein [Lysinibacillus sphaericus]QPA57087.1 hypothetical protein INQ55_12680 [Lysinibacillus sphaericus]